MNIATARQIVVDTVKARQRWGKMFNSAYTIEQVLDALVLLDSEGAIAIEEANEGRAEELTKVKRQLTAAKAREAKQKKQIEDLKEHVKQLQESVNHD